MYLFRGLIYKTSFVLMFKFKYERRKLFEMSHLTIINWRGKCAVSVFATASIHLSVMDEKNQKQP